MTFAATIKKGPGRRNLKGRLVEEVYDFTGASGDTGGQITTGLKEVWYAYGMAWLTAAPYTRVSDVTAMKSPTDSKVVTVQYTNPAANHTGVVHVVGRRG